MSLTSCFTSTALVLVIAAITSAYSLINDNQHPLHDHMNSNFSVGFSLQQPLHNHTNSNFSVGFSLQSCYIAAAVIFESSDGRLITYTREYEPGYHYYQVMTQLSLESSQHLAPPYRSNGEYWLDAPRKSARLALKSLGLPASFEVGVLAQGIQHLRSQLESDFGISISEAVFTSSHLSALYQDDLEDAAEIAGIKYVVPRWFYQPIFWETASAYAGHGLGMCEHWRDEQTCEEEMGKLPETVVLAVHYSHNALTVSRAKIHTAFDIWEPGYLRVENFTLGSDAIPRYPSPNEYWADVQKTLLKIMKKYPRFHMPDLVMVTGDMAYGYFMDLLKETIFCYINAVIPILSTDVTVIAAKGAAEIMRRASAGWEGDGICTGD